MAGRRLHARPHHGRAEELVKKLHRGLDKTSLLCYNRAIKREELTTMLYELTLNYDNGTTKKETADLPTLMHCLSYYMDEEPWHNSMGSLSALRANTFWGA